jgi:hypothetical protein
MVLPRKVKEAGDRAEAELQSLRNGLTTATPNQGTPPAEQVQPQPPATPNQGTPPAGTETINWQDEAQKAIHKYNVLNGKYVADVQRLRDENRSLSDRIQALEVRGAEAPSTGDPGSQAAPTGDAPDWIKETYGDQLPAWVQQIAREAASSAVEPVRKKIESEDRNKHMQMEVDFYNAIAEEHPDWQTINQLEAFHEFLATLIPGTSMERQVAIKRGQDELNPAPVIAQFSEFKKLYGTGEQRRLQSQQVPVPGGGGQLPSDGEIRSFKESEIAQFYSDVSKGKYRGRMDEVKRLEGLIRTASEAGKIVFDLTPQGR